MTALTARPLPTERRFGFTFAALLAAGGTYGFFEAWSPRTYGACLLLSLAFGIGSIAAPRLLAPLNRAWFRLGHILGRIINPVVLAAIFFLLVTPVAIVGRLLGRDELRLRRRAVASYWLPRTGSCASPDSFKNQF